MKIIWRMAQRYYEARSRRALKASIKFREKAEKFFTRIKGA